jgi:hypothetical protein
MVSYTEGCSPKFEVADLSICVCQPQKDSTVFPSAHQVHVYIQHLFYAHSSRSLSVYVKLDKGSQGRKIVCHID